MRGYLAQFPIFVAPILVSRDLADMGTSSVALMESLKSGVPVSLDLVTRQRRGATH